MTKSFLQTFFGIALFIAVITPTLSYAIVAPTDVGGCAGSGTLSNVVLNVTGFSGQEVPTKDEETRTFTGAEAVKECVLDGLAVTLRETLVTNITRNILNWVNNGFQGNPAFVTNLGQYFQTIADREAQKFIESSELNALGAFQTLLRSALARDYYTPFSERIAVTPRTEAQDGLLYWLEFAKGNNVFRKAIDTQEELYRRIASEQELRGTSLDWGRGFDAVYCNDSSELGPEDVCTPGSVVEEQVNNQLQSPLRQLELADEINEILSALLNQLTVQIFTGANGLFGLSQSQGGERAYVDRLMSDARGGTGSGAGGTQSVNSLRGGALTSISQLRSAENSYRLLRLEALETLREAEELLRDVIACYEKKPQTAETQVKIGEATATIESDVAARLSQASNDVASAAIILNRLDEIEERVRATSNATVLKNFLLEIQELDDHSNLLVPAQNELAQVQNDMNALNAETQAELAVCQGVVLSEE